LTCLQVDRINPVAAADLAECLADWDMLDEDHRQLMKAQLRRLAGTKGLSSDTREIVEDALEEGSSDDSSD
jgi:aminopeptidase N